MGGDPDGTASTAALQEQWQLLNATVPGAAAYILLQGETVALYQEGKLKIPDSVIPVLTPAPSASSAVALVPARSTAVVQPLPPR